MSNLPPGVRVSDIPGNRPEDEAEEAFWNEVEKRCKDDIEVLNKRFGVQWIFDYEELARIIQAVRDIGYVEGTNEERLAHEMERAYGSDSDD